MIPAWKVRRELVRLVTQIRTLPRRAIEPALRWNHDRTRWARIRIEGTEPPQTDKICVLLVYQPSELPASILTTCSYLSDKGYSVLLVANGGLRPQDRALVAPLIWRLMERPNFGYDFGGYRDAIHHLMREGQSPRFLILMNDSIWFPMHTGQPVIERLEASEFDLTGLLLHVPARNEIEEGMRRRPRRRKLAEHIESYVTIVPRHVFLSEPFVAFWQGYKQTSSKTLTIKRGEIGFSKALSAAGMTIGALSRRSLFLEAILEKSDDFLARTIHYAAYSDAEFSREAKELSESRNDPDWRQRALKHISTVVARRRFNASFCWATEQIFATSFVKKHPDMLFQLNRMRFLEAVDNGDLECNNTAAIVEMRARAERDRAAMKKDQAR